MCTSGKTLDTDDKTKTQIQNSSQGTEVLRTVKPLHVQAY